MSAAAFSLGHGSNDAQKTMGMILALLIAADKVSADADVPLWVVLSCHAAIALGTLFGGWRIVRTMGTKLTRLQPMGGVCAETAAASMLFFASANGIPVSTTHTITGGIVGVGSAQRMSAVRWGVARTGRVGLGAHHPGRGPRRRGRPTGSWRRSDAAPRRQASHVLPRRGRALPADPPGDAERVPARSGSCW